MCVINLPRVALDSRVARNQTLDSLTSSPAYYCYTTKTHSLWVDKVKIIG